MAKISKSYLLAGLSGLIAALAYSYSGLGFLVLISLVPLFFVLAKSSALKSNFHGLFWYGFASGIVYFLFSFRWFLALYPLDGLGIENRFISIILVIIVWLLISAVMAISWGLFGFVVSRFKLKSYSFVSCLLSLASIPALFVLLDYLRSYVIAIFGYGSGSLFGPHWTLGNLAYSISANNFFLRLASFVGIYGVLFVIVLINLLVFELTRQKKVKSTAGLVAILIIVSVLGVKWKPQETGNEPLKFSIIQTQQAHKLGDDSSIALDFFKKEIMLLSQSVKEHPESQIIIFPEGSDFFKNLSAFLPPAQIKNYFANLSKDPKLIIDNSRVSTSSDTAYSRVLFLNTKQDLIGYYDKKLLTPGGEYLPYFVRFLIKLVAPKTKTTFESLGNFSAGQGEKLANFENINFRAAACSDFLSPNIIRRQTSDVDLLIGLASTAIFHGSSALIRQNIAINQFRAAENNTPLVLAANDGRSYVLSSLGNITKISPNSSSQLLTGTVVIGAKKSWYNEVGDWPMFLASVLILLASVISLKLSPKR